ncbi:uncharacterized protein LAESUDRAFT_739618 [Laetiporus sulphureus 93-53]|uniref:F-box domain-containing protein n=1 Tax=Laetiporus sulphureus 93-53 TaxID=1314785 RepID=A0A165B7D8_9APHY|nr:uncharacterized protein LAESUDRAFT_739618 [Laetiporus sulphureus 93-53]KZT00414.1 hypothetical protein LAESUDRAFT_739618 [Laetiporus sulphureus 93-53]
MHRSDYESTDIEDDERCRRDCAAGKQHEDDEALRVEHSSCFLSLPSTPTLVLLLPSHHTLSPPTMSPSCKHSLAFAHRRVKERLRAVVDRLHIKRHSVTHNPRPNCSNRFIPSEIWAIIIKHACLSDHDPLDTSQELSFLESSHAQLATYRAVMRIKLALLMVCREWNALARPFLYEFIWISRATQAQLLVRTLVTESFQYPYSCTSGQYLRRLHIETLSLERCSPADLRTILEFAPHLSIFSDHHSVRRSLLENPSDPRCSPEEILRLVAHPKIRRLSWTCYDDRPFQLRMHPLECNLATRLEYLELSCYSPHFRIILAESLSQPNGEKIDMDVSLPSLRALKVSLDNNTFAALASWEMPRLMNLSVVSSDFSYTGLGFAQFFQAHGSKLSQLELGHSSAIIEEHYLTTPHHVLQLQQNAHALRPIPLADWCPNLREFICSADAEWHWQSPDWIAPHILLPAHPRIELIGIRDIDTRLLEDAPVHAGDTPYFPLFEQLSSLLHRDAFPSLLYVRDMSAESHRMRTDRPDRRVVQFWTRVVERCRDREVYLEDYSGVNITLRNLQQAVKACC